MSIITLITDWKEKGFYLATLKGKLLSHLPNVNIIDISHEVSNFSIVETAFILRNTYHHFPKGTIHLIGVESEKGNNYKPIVAKINDHYFIGTDNGIFSLISSEKAQEIIEIKLENDFFTTFPELDIFAEVAIFIAKEKGDLTLLGNRIEKINEKVIMRAFIDTSLIDGSVMYIDVYGNIITNIDFDLFERISKNRKFKISAHSYHHKYTTNKISKSYHDVNNGEMLAIFNSLGMLEIAICNGRADEQLNLSKTSIIRVKFFD